MGVSFVPLIVIACAADAQTDTTATFTTVVVRDASTALGLAVRSYTAPFRWDGHDWLCVAGGVTLTGLSAIADRDMQTMMVRNRTSTLDRLADDAIHYGDGLDVAIGVGGLYGVGFLVHDPWLRETMMLAGTATLVSASISTVAKFVVGRARPYTGRGNHFFKPFSFSEDHLSFPSGHTIVAFSISSVLAERIGNPWATVGLYALATSTALGRIYTQNHWLSDVVPAALCSSVIGRTMVRWYEQDDGESSLMIIPGPGSIALIYYL